MGMRNGAFYPKVAPEPIIYCPSVLITPFGPAPYRMILTEPSKLSTHVSQLSNDCSIPNIKPMMTPTAKAPVSNSTIT